MEKHYVLEVGGRGKGNHSHNTLEEAKEEAERLCKKEGLPVTVWEYRDVMICSIKETPVEWTEIKEDT